jgi:hypothetical protein
VADSPIFFAEENAAAKVFGGNSFVSNQAVSIQFFIILILSSSSKIVKFEGNPIADP